MFECLYYYYKMESSTILLLKSYGIYIICIILALATSLAFVFTTSCNDGYGFCDTYQNGGIGEIISNDNILDPIASFIFNNQTFNCNLYHVNNLDYPIGYTFDINYKKDDFTTCVTDEYKDNYIDNKIKKEQTWYYICIIFFTIVYLQIFQCSYMLYNCYKKCYKKSESNIIDENNQVENVLIY